MLAQTHAPIEVLVVNDGSLREEDAFLYELAEQGRITVVTQVNAGLERGAQLRHRAGARRATCCRSTPTT